MQPTVMQRTFAVLLLMTSSLLVLNGCGNKGPLYLPADPVEQTEEAAPAE